MPYISTEQVKSIRETLKKTFPEIKFSVTREHHSMVNVILKSGSVDFGTPNASVNEFWIDRDWAHNPQAANLLKQITEIVTSGNYIVNVDSDYGSIPKFYTNISIGEWNKPYVVAQ